LSNKITNKMFIYVSRMLRKTPLRRVDFVNRLHTKLYLFFSKATHVQVRGFTLEVDPRDQLIAKKLALYGGYEEYLSELLISIAQPGSVVIDIGADIGVHTVPLAARVGKQGRVIAFEPDPDNYQILTRNLQANNLSNVIAHNLAISSESGKALLYQDASNRGALSLNPSNVAKCTEPIEAVPVKTVVGDDFLEEYKKNVSLIKIDIEGAEPIALQSLEKTISANPDVKVVFEFIPRYIRNFGLDPHKFLVNLEEAGRRLGVIDEEKEKVLLMNAQQIMELAKKPDRI